MAKYIVKRLFLCVLVLVGVVVITFLITHVLPSDPARQWAGPKASAEQVAEARIKLGLNRPLIEQFVDYVSGLIQGDLGTSYISKQPVLKELRERIPATLELIFYASILSVILGNWMGTKAAKYKGRWPDHAVRLFSTCTSSIPGFAEAILLQMIFCSSLRIMPMGGRISILYQISGNIPYITGWITLDSLLTGNWALMGDAFWHLILPGVPILLCPAGGLARMTRSSMLEILGEDYITAERSYGIRESFVLNKYALKNTLGTTATVVALNIGMMLVNTFLVESIFSFPGIGSYVSSAVLALDFPAIMGVTLFATVSYLILNLIADLVTAIDPRVRA